MRLKIIFSKSTELVPINNQKELNTYIHKCLGVNNSYHDSFSDYSISSLQGGKLVGKNMVQYDEPHFYISGEILGENAKPIEIITKIMEGVVVNSNFGWGMSFLKFEVSGQKVGDYYDKIQTISPILLKNKVSDKQYEYLTYKDDDFINVLL